VKQRVQKILAAAGIASRRGAEDLIRAGRVTIDGAPASVGVSADPDTQRIEVDGRSLQFPARDYWLVHKPRGVLTTVRDPRGRPTVLELLPDSVGRLFPVGRLDRDTEGLVLLTNDGALAQVLLHPSHGNEREYRVRVRGTLSAAALRQIESGVELPEGRTAAARVAAVNRRSDTTRFQLTLREGRKRQIRRALAALGHPVLVLTRVRFGPLRLGRLPAGVARRLTAVERRALKQHAEKLVAAPREANRPRATRRQRSSKNP